jgi:hypothetical protein
METVSKLINGLERAAADTNALVRFGRPVELRRAPHTDLSKLLEAAIAGGAPLLTAPGSYKGEFDAPALSEALKNITSAAHPSATPTATMPKTSATATTAPETTTTATTATATSATATTAAAATAQDTAGTARPASGINLRREEDDAGAPFAVVEWSGTNFDGESDAFRTFAGGHGLRLALAAKIIRAHGGHAEQQANTLRVRLPLQI